jgi:hypothetical protein
MRLRLPARQTNHPLGLETNPLLLSQMSPLLMV